MARRILGAFVILKALAPLVLLSVFALASVITVRRISHAAGEYRHRVGAAVAAARANVETANQGFTALGTSFTRVHGAIDRVARDVARLASSLSIPLPKIRSIPIPGAAPFKRVVADVAAATRAFAGEIWSAAVRWIVVVLGVLSVGVVVWLVGSVARIVSEVRRGWNLLWGAAPAY